ncbi:MAG: hypothetical protein ABIK62_03060 [candidate division WOR-3 bacterium]
MSDIRLLVMSCLGLSLLLVRPRPQETGYAKVVATTRDRTPLKAMFLVRSYRDSLPAYVGKVVAVSPGPRRVVVGAWGYWTDTFDIRVRARETTLVRAWLNPILEPDESTGVLVARAIDLDARPLPVQVWCRSRETGIRYPEAGAAGTTGHAHEVCLRLPTGHYTVWVSHGSGSNLVGDSLFKPVYPRKFNELVVRLPTYRVVSRQGLGQVSITADSVLDVLKGVPCDSLLPEAKGTSAEARNNGLKTKVWQIYRKRCGQFALSTPVRSVDPDANYNCLFVHNGQATRFWGGWRDSVYAISLRNVDRLELGTRLLQGSTEPSFVPFDRSIPKQALLQFRLISGADTTYFW